MSTHNIDFYERNGENYLSVTIKYHQIPTLSVLMLSMLMINGVKLEFEPKDEPLLLQLVL